jgi:hypothetical protein
MSWHVLAGSHFEIQAWHDSWALYSKRKFKLRMIHHADISSREQKLALGSTFDSRRTMCQQPRVTVDPIIFHTRQSFLALPDILMILPPVPPLKPVSSVSSLRRCPPAHSFTLGWKTINHPNTWLAGLPKLTNCGSSAPSPPPPTVFCTKHNPSAYERWWGGRVQKVLCRKQSQFRRTSYAFEHLWTFFF